MLRFSPDDFEAATFGANLSDQIQVSSSGVAGSQNNEAPKDRKENISQSILEGEKVMNETDTRAEIISDDMKVAVNNNLPFIIAIVVVMYLAFRK